MVNGINRKTRNEVIKIYLVLIKQALYERLYKNNIILKNNAQ